MLKQARRRKPRKRTYIRNTEQPQLSAEDLRTRWAHAYWDLSPWGASHGNTLIPGGGVSLAKTIHGYIQPPCFPKDSIQQACWWCGKKQIVKQYGVCARCRGTLRRLVPALASLDPKSPLARRYTQLANAGG